MIVSYSVQKYVVRLTCGPVGGANFGHGAKTPGRDEARDKAKASRRSNFDEGPRSTMRRSTLSCMMAKGRQRRCQEEG